MSRTLSVHPKYIQEVKSAWKRKSDGCEENLANELGLSLPVIDLFLKGKSINRLSFLEICQQLELNWREISGLEAPKSLVSSLPAEVNSNGKNGSSTLGSTSVLSSTVKDTQSLDLALNELVGTLCEMLRRLTRKAGDLLNADRTSIFLLDPYGKELCSIIAEDGCGGSLMIDIPSDRGIASLAATSGKVINIPFDVYNDPRSEEAKKTDKKTGYRTYTILAWPVFNEQKNLVAVVQLINKLKPNSNPQDDLSKRIDSKGFTEADEVLFARFAPSILQILERCQFCYELTQKLKEQAASQQTTKVLQNEDLIIELKRQEEKLRKSLDRM